MVILCLVVVWWTPYQKIEVWMPAVAEGGLKGIFDAVQRARLLLGMRATVWWGRAPVATTNLA